MKLISENLHIISPQTKEAIVSRDAARIKNLLTRQAQTKPDWIDLNIGPARKNFEGTMKWLTDISMSVSDIPLSFDSTNAHEIRAGLETFATLQANTGRVQSPLHQNTQKCIINSTSADPERLEIMTDLAAEFGTYLIALTLNNEIGIPKFADKRLELAFEIIEKCGEKDIENEKIIFDPLILPVCVDQSQASEALTTITMIKESFEPQTLTTIGLSNVSNGVPNLLRPLINRVFFILAAGCGLDTAIVDSFDDELLRINKVIETLKPEKDYDNLILRLLEMQQNFGDIADIEYDKTSREEVKIYKTAEILLNKKVYSNSYLEI